MRELVHLQRMRWRRRVSSKTSALAHMVMRAAFRGTLLCTQSLHLVIFILLVVISALRIILRGVTLACPLGAARCSG